MTLLDRYVFKELFGPFLFGIAAFSSILAGSTVLFQLVGESTRLGIPLMQVIQLFIYRLPSLIVFTFPMSMLLATILAFGRLSSDLEIIAFRASGISIYRLVAPVILTGLVVSFLTIGFNEFVVPRASHSAEELMQSLIQKDLPTIKKNINYTQYNAQGVPTRIINVLEIDGSKLKGITVAEFDNGELSRVIRADVGRFLGIGAWEFDDGVMHYLLGVKDRMMVLHFEKERINIKLDPKDLGQREKSVEEMNARELRARISQKAQTGSDVTSDLVKYHMKFAVPFACLIFSILGASMGLRPHRSSSAIGLGVSLIIIIVYYILLSLGMGLGLSQLLPPLIAAWMPNIIIGTTSLYLLYKVAYQ